MTLADLTHLHALPPPTRLPASAKKKAYDRAWQRQHRAARTAYNRAWRRKNPARVRAIWRRYEAKRKARIAAARARACAVAVERVMVRR
jgi:hypothetical protein